MSLLEMFAMAGAGARGRKLPTVLVRNTIAWSQANDKHK